MLAVLWYVSSVVFVPPKYPAAHYLNWRGANVFTTLYITIQKLHLDRIKTLLDIEAFINMKDDHDRTPLGSVCD